MQVAVADLSQCRKDLTVEVPVEEVKAAFDKAYDAYARYVKIPGFRPGRAPRGVVKQRFAKEAKEEVVKNLVQHALEHAVADHNLHIVGHPQIDDISVSEDEPMRFKATLEVMPEFELKEYKGLTLTKRIELVTDKDIDNVLERFRESSAEFVPVEDRPSQDGDFVSVNLVGKYVEPPEEEDLKSDDVQIEIGGSNVQSEFNENLRGVKANEVREFRVKYPDDFSSKGLAGKTIDFTANVVAIREKEAPALDDDFARDFGDYENLQQLRDKIRENLAETAEGRAESRLRDDAVKRIMEDYDFELPPALVEPQAAERTREFAYMLLRNGVPAQTIREMNWEERMNEARPQAERDLRLSMVLFKIGDAENIEINSQEIDEEIERMVQMAQMEGGAEPADQLKARLTKDDSLSSIENRLRYQKAVETIVNHAQVTVEEIVEEITDENVTEDPNTEDPNKAQSLPNQAL